MAYLGGRGRHVGGLARLRRVFRGSPVSAVCFVAAFACSACALVMLAGHGAAPPEGGTLLAATALNAAAFAFIAAGIVGLRR